jgi:hypothetical protein
VLAAVVFMLATAQRSYESALDTVVKELSDRNARLCAAAAANDPEPWVPQARREQGTVFSVAAIATFTPGEHRWRKWARSHGALRAEVYDGMQSESLRRSRLIQPFEAWSGTRQFRSPISVQFEDMLGSHVAPLDMASLLACALVSLVLSGLGFTGTGLAWPGPPAFWAAMTLTVITIIYIATARRSMRKTGVSAARRLCRLPIPAMFRAETLLGDSFVARSSDERTAEGHILLQEMSCLVGAEEVPLQRRLHGQLHLYHAIKAQRELELELNLVTAVDGELAELARAKAAQLESTLLAELDLAVEQLSRAVARTEEQDPGMQPATAHLGDDGVALLALARALEMQRSSSSGAGDDARVTRLVARAVASTALYGRSLVPGAGGEQRAAMDANRWLWPQAAIAALANGVAAAARPLDGAG